MARPLKAAFARTSAVDNETLRVQGGRYQWFEVARIDKGAAKTSTKTKAESRRLARGHGEEALVGEDDGTVKKLDAGESFAAIGAAEATLRQACRRCEAWRV